MPEARRRQFSTVCPLLTHRVASTFCGQREMATKAEVVSVEIPMTFKKRGGRKVIVLPDGTHCNPAPMATIDNTMIKAVARAFRWQRFLENATYGCLDEIAKAEKIGPSFVSRVVRLALLAPDIVEAILAGKQPAHLTLKDLMQPFPVEWAGQRLQFGILGRQ